MAKLYKHSVPSGRRGWIVRITLLLVYAKPLHLRKYVNSHPRSISLLLNDNNGIFTRLPRRNVRARYEVNICMYELPIKGVGSLNAASYTFERFAL